MKYRVSVRKAAQADMQEAWDWYESQRPGLGDEFLLSLAASFMTLEELPYRVPVYYNGFRRIFPDGFPYKVFFRVENDLVIVHRILHAARDHRREL